MARAADPLEECGNPMRRPDLAHEIDVADVDAELERRGGDERLQRAGLQPVLGIESRLLRQAAVMRRDLAFADPLAQVSRDALGHPPRVHENQRRLVRRDQLGQPVVVLLPHLVRHDGAERRAGNLEREVERAPVALVDDGAVAAAVVRADEEPGDLLDRLLRGRQADALERAARRPATCCRRSSDSARWAPRRVPMTAWISSTITVRTVRSRSRLRPAVRSRYNDSGVVTRMCGGVRSMAARSDCVVSPVRTAAVMRGAVCAARLRELTDAAPRLRQVLVDVGAQRLQRRNVDDANFVGKRRADALLDEVVDRREKRGERLAGAGRRGDQRVAAVANVFPAARLRRRRRSQASG